MPESLSRHGIFTSDAHFSSWHSCHGRGLRLCRELGHHPRPQGGSGVWGAGARVEGGTTRFHNAAHHGVTTSCCCRPGQHGHDVRRGGARVAEPLPQPPVGACVDRLRTEHWLGVLGEPLWFFSGGRGCRRKQPQLPPEPGSECVERGEPQGLPPPPPGMRKRRPAVRDGGQLGQRLEGEPVHEQEHEQDQRHVLRRDRPLLLPRPLHRALRRNDGWIALPPRSLSVGRGRPPPVRRGRAFLRLLPLLLTRLGHALRRRGRC
mmetsp:Transcript_54660/g.132248  ORF Transcript_54660/g.132248 Transcript_54660/m.132248 type:complete len:262 (-) Transcript_54660:317-1102(-)